MWQVLEDVMTSSNDDNIIDLDAIADDAGSDGAEKPITLGQWADFKKRDPATLTPTQKAAMAKADATAREGFKRLAPHLERIKEAMQGSSVQNAIQAAARFNVADMMPRMYEPTLPDLKSIAIAPSATSVEQRKQTLLLEKLVETFEAQGAERDADIRKLLRPSYDAAKHTLIFGNTVISIPAGSDQAIICKRLFRAGKPVKQPVEKGDMYEKLGILGQNPEAMRKKLYSAKDALNDRIAKRTSISDLFVMVDKKLWFNEKYL